MKRVARLLLPGLGIYLVFLLAMLPAVQIISLIPNKQYGLGYGDISGSIWQGQISRLDFKSTSLKQLRWKLAPLQIFRGRLSFDLNFQTGEGVGVARVNLHLNGDLSIRHLKTNIAANSLGHILGLGALRPTGVVAIRMNEIWFSGNLPGTADGEIIWNQAQIQIAAPVVLGDLRARLESSEEGLVANLDAPRGPLQLQGKALFRQNRTYQVEGSARVREEGNQSLQNILRMLGVAGSNGSRKISFQGKLSDIPLF